MRVAIDIARSPSAPPGAAPAVDPNGLYKPFPVQGSPGSEPAPAVPPPPPFTTHPAIPAPPPPKGPS
jgi:hypothetical protein